MFQCESRSGPVPFKTNVNCETFWCHFDFCSQAGIVKQVGCTILIYCYTLLDRELAQNWRRKYDYFSLSPLLCLSCLLHLLRHVPRSSYSVVSGTALSLSLSTYVYLLVVICVMIIGIWWIHEQGFNWESSNKQGGWYNSLLGSIPELAGAGITHVWLPPPSQSVAPQGDLFFLIFAVFTVGMCNSTVIGHSFCFNYHSVRLVYIYRSICMITVVIINVYCCSKTMINSIHILACY